MRHGSHVRRARDGHANSPFALLLSREPLKFQGSPAMMVCSHCSGSIRPSSPSGNRAKVSRPTGGTAVAECRLACCRLRSRSRGVDTGIGSEAAEPATPALCNGSFEPPHLPAPEHARSRCRVGQSGIHPRRRPQGPSSSSTSATSPSAGKANGWSVADMGRLRGSPRVSTTPSERAAPRSQSRPVVANLNDPNDAGLKKTLGRVNRAMRRKA